ncbi:hypothetical protein CCACVL1_05321 [Corchorus capsularis]|uniref:Uncharacterized protein n=1 Tax=Corchorus capsularis TaxID=210143 RepID=A0A1R3JLF2_COCAP|nr:hypothetical protein CCACVL1_05321 [Corchorus capsularis]
MAGLKQKPRIRQDLHRLPPHKPSPEF